MPSPNDPVMTRLFDLGWKPSLRTPPYWGPRVLALVFVFTGLLVASTVPYHLASPSLAHAQAAGSSIEYAENGTRPVGVFHAYDQDGDAIKWSLSGPDAGRFTIDGGVLAFRRPPNHEDPQSAAAGNVYRVTIEANGGTHDVDVTVVDVDEAGAVSIDRPQPQVSRPLGANLSDEDEGVSAQTWQWARSEDGTTWTDIEGATSPRRSPAAADVGTYLRATVTYSDKFGPGKTASAVSANRVEAKTLSNAAPSFADQDRDEDTPYVDVARSVAENTAVGRPIGRAVSATDADDDVLFYELLDTPDLEDEGGDARFTIDSASGQIRVGKVLGADPGEEEADPGEREDEDSTELSGVPALPDDEDADDAGNSEYVLRVRVSDPSTASATVNVIVTVTDMNEAPHFADDAPTVLRVRENQGLQVDPLAITLEDGETGIDDDTFAVTDQDVDDTIDTYSVTVVDSEVLAFNGILRFVEGHEPDFEDQSSYSITVVARSGEGRRRLSTTLDVTIEVVDGEDPGEVTLSQRQPQVGIDVHATASDPDGGVSVTRWVWERSDKITAGEDGVPSAECRDDSGTPGIGVVQGWATIGGASSSVYTVKEADVGKCLRATATYTDNIEDADEEVTGVVEAPVQISSPANAAPKFVDQSNRPSRKVTENTKAGQDIGPPFSAHDDDGDLLIYSLGGVDAASFGISRNNGQLKTEAPLDHEGKSRYTVEVTATDPSGAADSILVTISVTNENEPAQISGRTSMDFAENGTGSVEVFSAYDQDRNSIRWSLNGRDADRFAINFGVLRFKNPPNYEDPQSVLAGASLAERNVYLVTIEAAGGTHDVAVRVTDVDEAGKVSTARPQPQADRLFGASLSDEDDGVAAERWQWARSEDGRTWTDIEGATSTQRRPALADVGMYLRATVTYSDKFGTGKTASAVSANRVEAKTLSNAAPSFGEQDGDKATPYIDVARSVSENTAVDMPIGEPVSASDADNDILFYELLDTPDLEYDDGHARFTIDSLSGQIRVARVLGADAGEQEDEDSTELSGVHALPDGEDADESGNSEYVLRVMVSDPSTASATVNVIVTVAEVNEPPAFHDDAPTVLRVRENPKNQPVITLGDGETPIDDNTFAVTDQDGEVTGPEGYNDTTYTYSVSGTDGSFFAFNSTSVLGFRANREPDFEDQSSYSITILASSGEGSRKLTARLNVVIEVVNTHDVGEVLLSQRQPQVGIAIVATLSDPDGGVTITRWVWERTVDFPPSDKCEGINTDDEYWTAIGEASAAVYLPKPADLGRCLRAMAFYTDNLDNTELEATGVLEDPVGRHGSPGTDPASDTGFVNAAPVFPDQDFSTEGDQSDRTSREVAENTDAGRNIGAPVSAQDEDDDLLIYTLSGVDAAFFSIGREDDGQLKTRAALNYETRSSYSVVVTATDPFGAADSILVTINVTDEDDPAEITVNTHSK